MNKSVLWFWGSTTVVLASSLFVLYMGSFLLQYSAFGLIFALSWGIYMSVVKRKWIEVDRITRLAPWLLLALLVIFKINMIFVFIFAIAGIGTGRIAEGADIYLKIVASVYWIEQFLFLIPLAMFIKIISQRESHA